MKSELDRIEDALRRTGVFSMDPQKRRGIAIRLAEAKFTSGQVQMVWGVARSGNADLQMARGLFAQAVQEPARFREIVNDQEEAEARLREPQESGLAFVTEQNPYGWSQPDRMRWHDHSRPGEWNPYRQSQNLTTAEARELGHTDVRRHGCSRYEVMGGGDWEKVRRLRAGKGRAGETIQDATPYWDQMPVDCARSVASAPTGENPGKVYGEGDDYAV